MPAGKQDLIIGGNHIQDDDIPAQVERLKSDRAILVMPVNDDADDDPALKQCKTIDEVFKEYKPSTDIPVKDEGGSTEEVKIQFKKVKEFDVESIVDTVPAMKSQKEKLCIQEDLKNQLKENVKLRQAVDSDDQRQKLIASLESALKALKAQ